LWILGLPLVLAQALLSGLLTFIPNLGPTLTVVPPMAIALLQNPYKPFFVLGMYVAIQQIETNLLTPFVMAKQVSLLPAVTLLSQVFFATFFGFFGLLLALPLTVVAQVWLQEVLVKDVLDQWRSPHPVLVTESVTETGDRVPLSDPQPGKPEVTRTELTLVTPPEGDSESPSDS
jgi:predicted PurR-regulated permease PerM